MAAFTKGEDTTGSEQPGGLVKIKNNNGSVQYVDNRVYALFNFNKNVRENMSQEFKSLDSDKNISGFSLLDKKNNPIVEIESKDFYSIGNIKETVISSNHKTIIKQGVLNIFKVVFKKDMKWEFYYEGVKISGKIIDENFNALIEKGEKFSKGDSLESEIEISQKFDSTLGAYVNKSYTITRIIKHIPRKKDTKELFD